jgi:hypothetical protein
VAFSLEWNVPDGGVVVDGDALALGAVVAAWLTMNPPANAPVSRPVAVTASAARRRMPPNAGAFGGAGGKGGGLGVVDV